ncbi:MAG: hypothetical protein ACRDPX_07500 [Gaiellaceae bacterium]
MRTLVVALIGVVAFGGGVMLGNKLDSDGKTTATETGLPAPVGQTRAALLEAAESGDYEALRPLVSDSLEYTFGSPVEGGPIAYWQRLEEDTDARPLESLAAILKMPYVLSRGYYVWPWAYTVETAGDLSEHEVELLAPLGPPSQLFPAGSGYLGWRAGFAPDGTWAFFVAGD